jgi:hypothetical protein
LSTSRPSLRPASLNGFCSSCARRCNRSRQDWKKPLPCSRPRRTVRRSCYPQCVLSVSKGSSRELELASSRAYVALPELAASFMLTTTPEHQAPPVQSPASSRINVLRSRHFLCTASSYSRNSTIDLGQNCNQYVLGCD